jgi:hypothetical protein
MFASQKVFDTLSYCVVVVVTLSILHSATVVMHEFTHSTVAWLIGYMPSPLSIVWGNPLTMRGWDEGVPYHRLFPSSGNPAEAIIGGSPLAVHTILVVVGLVLLQRQGIAAKKWTLHALYWFTITNLSELISYIAMRPFDPGGDTGHFNRGVALSPWILFVAGSFLLVLALYILFAKALPLMNEVFAKGNRLTEWAILAITAFDLFLWGSGIRVISTYPDPQWVFGLSGLAAFVFVMFACNRVRNVGR